MRVYVYTLKSIIVFMIVLLDKDTNVQQQVKGRCILTVYNLHILSPVLQTSWRVPGVVLTTVRGRDEDLVDGRVPYRDRLREQLLFQFESRAGPLLNPFRAEEERIYKRSFAAKQRLERRLHDFFLIAGDVEFETTPGIHGQQDSSCA